jgi:hypothetical protein
MSTSETGHAINVTNFQTLIAMSSSFGSLYLPQRADLTIANLYLMLAAALNSMSNVNASISAWKIAVATRDLTFRSLNELCTRILGALHSSNVRPADIENALTYIRKLRGQRATPKHLVTVIDPNTTTIANSGAPVKENHKNISASQMSFESRIANLDMLIKILMPLADYNPNEADLTVSALKSLYNRMVIQVNDVVVCGIELNNNRIIRDKLLYAANTGLIDTALAIKSYIKSVFKTNSPQYRKIAAISFKKSYRK